MSRLRRYTESTNKFINNRCNLQKDDIFDESTVKQLFDAIKKDDNFTLPIMLLTIINNQMRKNNTVFSGYYFASTIHVLSIIYELQTNRSYYGSMHSSECVEKLNKYFLFTVHKLFNENIALLPNSDSQFNKRSLSCINILMENLRPFYCETKKIIIHDTSIKKNKDVGRWYLQDAELEKELKKINPIDKKCYFELMTDKYYPIFNLAFKLGWIAGCGNKNKIKNVEKMSDSFFRMYIISENFKRIREDLDLAKHNNYMTLNYVLNYGMLDAYDNFLTNKEQFIQMAIILDIFSVTVKEILNYLTANVDKIIDESSSDLLSSISQTNS